MNRTPLEAKQYLSDQLNRVEVKVDLESEYPNSPSFDGIIPEPYLTVRFNNYMNPKDYNNEFRKSIDQYYEYVDQLIGEFPGSSNKLKIIDDEVSIFSAFVSNFQFYISRDSNVEQALVIRDDIHYSGDFILDNENPNLDPIYRKIYPFIITQYSILSSINNYLHTKRNEILATQFPDLVRELDPLLVEEKGKATITLLNQKINSLDIRQTALLFHYLKENDLILKYDNKNLSRIVQALTGHSGQNLRANEGFGVIVDIKRDKSKPKSIKKSNYNLSTVRKALSDILKQIDKDIKKYGSKK